MAKELTSSGQYEATLRSEYFWSNIHKIEDRPILVAAKKLRERGFGITLVEAVDANGRLLPSHYVSVYTATQEDRRALGSLIETDELKTLRLYAAAINRGPYLMPRGGLPPLSEDDMGFYVDQAIEKLGLKPGLPSLMTRLKRTLTAHLPKK